MSNRPLLINPALSVLSEVEREGLAQLSTLASPYEVVLLPAVRLASAVNLNHSGLSRQAYSQALVSGASVLIAQGRYLRPILAVDFDQSALEVLFPNQEAQAKEEICRRLGLPLWRATPSSLISPKFKRDLDLLLTEACDQWQSGGDPPADRRRGLLCNAGERRTLDILERIVERYGFQVLVKPQLMRVLQGSDEPPLQSLCDYAARAEVDFQIVDEAFAPVMSLEFDELAHLYDELIIARDMKKKMLCDLDATAWSPQRIFAEHLDADDDGMTPLERIVVSWLDLVGELKAGQQRRAAA